ncbi:hypothetical protein AG1IA_04832 [Rhizoctonia solani AG-1 IA]|uniref:Uncharacterized protein n=1 Tax=Thanatephorus cucumeris (strain AG1-IA) TaxID=983506 RepID=L8WXN6_THACA|nr:hypothetical protein AG1IA_04832 [Rhizoctonia solani AG-1 IA]
MEAGGIYSGFGKDGQIRVVLEKEYRARRLSCKRPIVGAESAAHIANHHLQCESGGIRSAGIAGPWKCRQGRQKGFRETQIDVICSACPQPLGTTNRISALVLSYRSWNWPRCRPHSALRFRLPHTTLRGPLPPLPHPPLLPSRPLPTLRRLPLILLSNHAPTASVRAPTHRPTSTTAAQKPPRHHTDKPTRATDHSSPHRPLPLPTCSILRTPRDRSRRRASTGQHSTAIGPGSSEPPALEALQDHLQAPEQAPVQALPASREADGGVRWGRVVARTITSDGDLSGGTGPGYRERPSRLGSRLWGRRRRDMADMEMGRSGSLREITNRHGTRTNIDELEQEDDCEDAEIDAVVVDNQQFLSLDKSTQRSQSTHPHHVDDIGTPPTGPTGSTSSGVAETRAMVLLRYRIWPVIERFFSLHFHDPVSEAQYIKETFYTHKTLAFWASFLNWVLATSLLSQQPYILGDKIFVYGVAPVLTVPLPVFITFDWPRTRPWIYQIWLAAAVWSWACYVTGLPVIAIFALGQNRTVQTFMVISFVCTAAAFVSIFYTPECVICGRYRTWLDDVMPRDFMTISYVNIDAPPPHY